MSTTLTIELPVHFQRGGHGSRKHSQMVEENFNEYESHITDARLFSFRATNAHKQQSSRCS